MKRRRPNTRTDEPLTAREQLLMNCFSIAAPVLIRTDSLTLVEKKILVRILWGHSTKQIAHDLGLAPSTVSAYRTRINHKLRGPIDVDRAREIIGWAPLEPCPPQKRPPFAPTLADVVSAVSAALRRKPHVGLHWSQWLVEDWRRRGREEAERLDAISNGHYDPLLEYPSPPFAVPACLAWHEVYVLVLTAYRQSAQQIADTLRVQRQTVYDYRHEIRRKLGLRGQLTIAKAREIIGLPAVVQRPQRRRAA
jgi:DNA-binding CsgD family transcriptional regulator